MAGAFFSRSNSPERQIEKSKPWSTWVVGVFALLALAMMLAAGCSSSSTKSGSELGSAELKIVETPSTSSTVQSEASPLDVTTTVGGLDDGASSADVQPDPAAAQQPQSSPSSAPTTQYVPPTTRYVCVPDSSALLFLESDYRHNQYLYNLAYSDLIAAGSVYATREINATRSINAAEYERARSAINSCQGTYWNFLTY